MLATISFHLLLVLASWWIVCFSHIMDASMSPFFLLLSHLAPFSLYYQSSHLSGLACTPTAVLKPSLSPLSVSPFSAPPLPTSLLFTKVYVALQRFNFRAGALPCPSTWFYLLVSTSISPLYRSPPPAERQQRLLLWKRAPVKACVWALISFGFKCALERSFFR